MLAKLVEAKLIDALQFEYGEAKEGVRNSLIILLGEDINETIQQGKMDSLQIRYINELIQSERSYGHSIATIGRIPVTDHVVDEPCKMSHE